MEWHGFAIQQIDKFDIKVQPELRLTVKLANYSSSMCCIIFSLSMAISTSFSIFPDSSEMGEASGALGATVVSGLVVGGVVVAVEKVEEKEGV